MAAYATAYAHGLLPEPDLLVSEWADAHRMLDQAASSEPGRWRTSRTPYLKEIMDCLSATRPEEVVVVMKGAQLGLTETGNNWLGYVIHHAPGPMLYVMPTVDTAKRNSKQRIAPMLDGIPEVAAKIATPRARDSGNTLFQKDYPGGTLIITGANSAVGLRSMPARYLFLDEVDGYPMDLDGEGSPIQLAMRRTATFKRNRKIFMLSTPTIKGLSIIEDYFEQSDQRRFFVPCPECGEYQTIEWARIKWFDGDPSTVKLQCEHCGCLIPEEKKTRMMLSGEWRPTAKGQFTGFHVSSLYSPLGWYSWEDAVREFIQAKDIPEQLKTWVNTVLGETWEEDGETVEMGGLMARAEDYTGKPDKVVAVTFGADVQKDRIEVEVVGWAAGEESWSLDYQVLPGDPTTPEPWDQLDELLREWKPVAGVVDSGYSTDAVYSYCAKYAHIYPGKGVSGTGKPLVESDLQRRQRLRKLRKKGHAPEPIYVDTGKLLVLNYLQVQVPGPGYCHFPKAPTHDDEYFAQLTGEKLVTRYRKGRPFREWIATRHRVEALDCRVYALAALRLSGVDLNTLQPDAPKRRWRH
jgi:phage terminase large subunit GpA-like protein